MLTIRNENMVCLWVDFGEMVVLLVVDDREMMCRTKSLSYRLKTDSRRVYKVVSGEPDWMYGTDSSE